MNVGDFVLYEDFGEALAFETGEVKWIDYGNQVALVTCAPSIWSSFRPLHLISTNFIRASGSREDIKRLHKRISKMATNRKQALAERQNDVVELAGSLAHEIRKEITKYISLAALFVALVASIVPARASPECKTIAEARVAYPNKHLWWSRAERGGRCWHDNGPTRSSITRRPVPLTEPAPAPRPSVLWPSLAGGEPPEAAALYHAEPMTRYPLLLDIDALTGGRAAAGQSVSPPLPSPDANGNDATADYCCWPALEPPFADRWYAMPASWFHVARIIQ